MKPAYCIAITAIFAASFISVSAQEAYYSAQTIPENLKENANAVLRLDRTSIEVLSRDQMRVYKKRIITVLNEKGNRDVGAYEYYDDAVKITELYAKIYDASGKEIKKIKERDFSDRAMVDGFSLYTDSRYKIMGYVPISYPYTVEFVSEIKTKNTGYIRSWNPVRDYHVSTEKSEYEVLYPPELELRFKTLNFENYPIKDFSGEGLLKYEAVAIKAMLPEMYSPPSQKIFPRLMLALSNFHLDGVDGDIHDWNDMGIWMNNKILTERNLLPETTRREINTLVAGIDDPIEKARKVVSYVQENTRYISVQVGIGGIQPASAQEVDKLKYGDCKGLTNYTKSLLEAVGVPSYYTVVESGDSKIGFHEDFASMAQGNHVILCIPTEEKNVFMDCTSQIHPFGFIGDFTDDREVFIVKPNGGEIVKTTAYIDKENYQHTKAEINIAESGAIDAEVTITTRGTRYDNRFYIENFSTEDQKKHYKKYWKNINNLNLKHMKHSNDKNKIQFVEHIKLSFDNYVTQISDKILVIANMFNNRYPIPVRYRNRQFPIDISRGFTDEDAYVIKLPKGYTIASIPAPISLSNAFGFYELSFEKTDPHHIIFKRKFGLKKGIYDKETYNSFRNFIKKISRSDQSKLVLNKKT